MPTILTPQGWVKVAPAKRKKPTNYDHKTALRGPLAYLACQPQAPGFDAGGGAKGKTPFPYDLSASPEKLKRQTHANAQKASRTVSAPVMRGALPLNDEDDYISEPEIEIRAPRSKPKTRSSRHHEVHGHSAASSSSSSSSHSSAPSSKSYNRHRPVEMAPHPAPATRSDHPYSVPRYNHYTGHPPPAQMPVHMSMPMPMPPINGRSLSYSWYNATTPLDLR
jgi:hypothetical protein